jgi:hypothetical protein
MLGYLDRLGQQGATRAEARRLARPEAKAGRGRPRHYVFRFQPRDKGFSLALQFRKSEVEKAEVVRALEAILASLKER